jgi:hypothetical protein
MNNKKIIFFITFSFFLSLLISFNFINKLDVYESDGLDHHIIKGDIDDIWSRGAKFKNDLVSGKNFLISGTEVYRSYLPPRLIGFFSIIFDYELLTNDKKLTQITIGFTKFYYLFIQSLIFYLIIFYFYKNLLHLSKNKQVSFVTLLFLCYCPNIFLYNSSFHTESIFFSLQLLLLTLLAFPRQSLIYSFIIGVIVTFLFLQKTVGIFYIFIVITYLSFIYKKKSFKFISIIILTYTVSLISIGYGNYKRMGVFYFMPTQGGEAVYHYFANNILLDNLNNSNNEILQKITDDLNNWKIENGIKEKTLSKNHLKISQKNSIEKDRLKIIKFKKDYTFNLIKEYPISTLKISTWKALQTLILDPVYIFHYHYFEQDLTKNPQWYLEKSYLSFWTPIKIAYSFLIYIVILIGFISSIKRLDFAYNSFLIVSALYMFVMLGWVGNNRYFSPSLVYLSIYFGFGSNFLINLIRFKKFNF